jgi:4-hydroxybenzoate polyprenyltransferase
LIASPTPEAIERKRYFERQDFKVTNKMKQRLLILATTATSRLMVLLALLSSRQLTSSSAFSSTSSINSYSYNRRNGLSSPAPLHEKSFLQLPAHRPTGQRLLLQRSHASTIMPTACYYSTTTKPLHMSVEGDFDDNDPDALSHARDEAQAGSIKARLRALYKFTRPHTIRGTVLASVAGTIRALMDTPGAIANANWSIMLPRAFMGMVALLLGNVFIVGINQIYDEDIDKMNKPFLPVASGEMSKRFAWLAVASSVVAGPWLVHKFYPPLLFYLYSTGIFLGAIYSIPPIRTKKNPVLAGLTIATVRGFLLNFGIYYAVKDAVVGSSAFRWSPKVAFIARFMTIFASVIAITKDLPDIEGDKVRVHFVCCVSPHFNIYSFLSPLKRLLFSSSH